MLTVLFFYFFGNVFIKDKVLLLYREEIIPYKSLHRFIFSHP